MSSSSSNIYDGPYRPNPTSVIFVIVFVVLFVFGTSSLIFCKCYIQRRRRRRQNPDDNPNSPSPSDPSSRKPNNGLDPTTLAAFPTVVYSNVKHLRRENLDLECAICLSDFEDDSVLRLLTICYHVFHQECIDIWLEDHISCPVCRASLDLPPEKILERVPEILSGNHQHEESEALPEDDVSVGIDDHGDDGKEKAKMWSGEQPTANTQKASERYPRWHSTGHSIVGNRSGGECRYTLRLPENVEGARWRNIDSGGVFDHYEEV